MRNPNKILIALIAISFIYGCGQKVKNFGQPITETKITRLSDILSGPSQFAGKSVLVEGTITDECPVGGWFFLKDGSGLIYVNLHPSYFAIPQARGREAVVEGKVRKEGTQIEIIGEGVRIK